MSAPHAIVVAALAATILVAGATGIVATRPHPLHAANPLRRAQSTSFTGHHSSVQRCFMQNARNPREQIRNDWRVDSRPA